MHGGLKATLWILHRKEASAANQQARRNFFLRKGFALCACVQRIAACVAINQLQSSSVLPNVIIETALK